MPFLSFGVNHPSDISLALAACGNSRFRLSQLQVNSLNSG